MKYTFTIVSVNEPARCMEVIYSAEGKPQEYVGVRIPFANETLESVINQFAPITKWDEMDLPLLSVPSGLTGEIDTTITPTPNTPVTEDVAIRARNIRLLETDWTQLPDVPLTAEQKSAWATYRQALRDVPSQPGFPANINWPVLAGIPTTVL